MRNKFTCFCRGLLFCTAAAVFLSPAYAARQRRTDQSQAGAQEDFVAQRLLKTGQDLLLAGEHERGVEVMKRVLEQFPDSDVRYDVYLTLGRHFLDVHKQQDAIGYLRYLRNLEQPGRRVAEDKQDAFLESLYLTGAAHFQMRQYGAAFPVLRKITNDYPETVWANQAYYYIGMGHFAQENWTKAIEALGRVGTYVDADSPGIEYAEAGQRLYVKIKDSDLSILSRLGKEVSVTVETKNGDKERMLCIPLSGDASVFIGSLPTKIGLPVAGNDVLEVLGGDEVYTVYIDSNTRTGETNISRKAIVKIVSTGSITITRGDYDTMAGGAFLKQPVFIVLRDADLDTTDASDTVKVQLFARRLKQEDNGGGESGGQFDLTAFLRDSQEQEQYEIRDEVTVDLHEVIEGDSDSTIVRSGVFRGRVQIEPISEGQMPDTTDRVLSCAVGDEILIRYVDELHIHGDVPRPVVATVKVLGEIESTPRATQYVVPDPVLRSKKNLVEASAYLELGRIFKSMGLMEGATAKCDSGIELVDDIIGLRESIPLRLREDAFKTKWELEITKGDFTAAINTCALFSRLFPHSPLIDRALMGIADSHLEKKHYDAAVSILRRILSLPESQIKPEASFKIAKCIEEQSPKNKEKAIAEYKQVAERFPDSEYAGEALGKLIDYFIETRDYARADDLLEQVFDDHPDAQFLDRMLLKWVIVAYRMQDFSKAQEKCSQLIFEYPTSSMAVQAKKILPNIERKTER